MLLLLKPLALLPTTEGNKMMDYYGFQNALIIGIILSALLLTAFLLGVIWLFKRRVTWKMAVLALATNVVVITSAVILMMAY